MNFPTEVHSLELWPSETRCSCQAWPRQWEEGWCNTTAKHSHRLALLCGPQQDRQCQTVTHHCTPSCCFRSRLRRVSHWVASYCSWLFLSVESSVLIGASLRRADYSEGTSLGRVGWHMALLGCSNSRELRETIFPSSLLSVKYLCLIFLLTHLTI